MASTDISTSSSQASTVAEDHKRTVDEAFLNKLKGLVERLRLENTTLKKSLYVERSEVRALKAQHEAAVRNIKTEHKKREELLERQLRNVRPEKDEPSTDNNKLVELKRLTVEIQSLKTANRGLQEKLKVAQAAECARAAELRAQVAKHAALETAARKDSRAQCHQLLEELKSKERVIIQLRREAARTAALQHEQQVQKMECGVSELSRKLRIEQAKEKSNREDLKTDIQHRKETFYREPPSDEDSAVSSAPASLSPQPLNDMWSCSQCRSASERADVSARECARLTDALRDARDQLELMEFRLLELEDAHPDKVTVSKDSLRKQFNKEDLNEIEDEINAATSKALKNFVLCNGFTKVITIAIYISLYFLVEKNEEGLMARVLGILLLVSIVPTAILGIFLIMSALGRKSLLRLSLILCAIMGFTDFTLGVFGFFKFIYKLKYSINIIIVIFFLLLACSGICRKEDPEVNIELDEAIVVNSIGNTLLVAGVYKACDIMIFIVLYFMVNIHAKDQMAEAIKIYLLVSIAPTILLGVLLIMCGLGARDNLTDSDSGCVSPGSRIKDSASPELKRMDSGYKSPHQAPSSPNLRRPIGTPHDDFKEDFAKAQVLADILDRNSETSDSLRSNPVKEHLEQMILNAASAEDRSCLEQVLMLMYNFQALSSSVSEDECFQAKPKKICSDLKPKPETDIPSHKTHKAVATVTPYQQKGYKCESLESLCSDERKPSSVLQESGIFEGVETESRCTQTDVNESFECSGELNTEIQRLNSIREKLERQGVRNRNLNSKEDGDGLECKCVKLGKKHKQYYERRLKFLEGKISIYEAAQDVKEAKLSQRLQKEFELENRIQELESQITELQDKYERLEEDCCELEEIENDTRLHWQQLEMDYELCSAQLRDMTEQRECSRAQAERLMKELSKNECWLKAREAELLTRLDKLEKAVPALIAWNVFQAIGLQMTDGSKKALLNRLGPLSKNTKKTIEELKKDARQGEMRCTAIVEAKNIINCYEPLESSYLEKQITKLMAEKERIQENAAKTQANLEKRVKELEEDLETARRQVFAAQYGATIKQETIDENIRNLEMKLKQEKAELQMPVNSEYGSKIRALLASEQELKNRVAELERRETAYLEMLTQADDMWAEMEGGYKKKINEAKNKESKLTCEIQKLECEKEEYRKTLEPIKKKLRELEETDSMTRVALEKAERDNKAMKAQNENLQTLFQKADAEAKKAEQAFKSVHSKFKKEMEELYKLNKQMESDLKIEKEVCKKNEVNFLGDLDSIRKELLRSSKHSQELEVTNSELKEEVESLERQLTLTQKALNQCKRKCDEKLKTLSHELSIKTEELEELRSETMRQTYHASRVDLKPERTEYIDEGYSVYTAVPKKTDYGRMHHSMSYITTDARCSCPSMRSQLVSQLIEDLFERIHNTVDDDLTRLCREITPVSKDISAETKAKITNYLLMAISKELVRSIGDADAKTDTEEWQRAISSMTYSVPNMSEGRGEFASLRLIGNAGVLHGAARLASVSCACAAARLCAAVPELADSVKTCQEEVLDHGDVKIMEEQLANAIESIVNCPSCALGTNSIVWSTDV